MKKIEFIKQGLENFCNHIEPIEIDFTKGSITMITGPNGIGKTSIFQAIPYTLYGQCEKGKGDDVLNDITGKNCHTWTVFKVDDIQYRVDRYVKYTKFGNSVIITKGDSTVPYLKGHNEVVPEIEKILIPYKLFMNTLLFSQKVKTFFTDLNDSDQKEIFRKIMTLDDYVTYGKTCNNLLNELTEKISIIVQSIAVSKGVIESTEQQRKTFEDKLKLFIKEKTEKLNNLKNEIERLNKEILFHVEKQKDLPQNISLRFQEVSNEISVLNHVLSNFDETYNSKIENINNQATIKVSELSKLCDNSSNESKSIYEDLCNKEKIKYKEEQELIKRQLDRLNKEMQDLLVKKERLISTINFMIKESKSLSLDSDLVSCPTCKRQINDECIKHLENLLHGKMNEINKTKSELSVLEQEIKEINEQEKSWIRLSNEYDDKEKDSLKSLATIYQNEIKELQERKTLAISKVKEVVKESLIKFEKDKILEKENTQKKVNVLQNELEMLREMQRKIDDYNVKLKQLQTSKEENENLYKLTEKSTFDSSLIQGCDEKIKKCKDDIVKYLHEKAKLDEEVKITEFWKTGFSSSGIQSMLIDEAIPFMNKRISYYMGLVSGGRYTVTFDTLKATKDAKEFRDKISVNVFDSQTHSDKRVKFSGGQTRLVDIGTILTLADLQENIQDTSVNILLFDEIFDSLDSENITYVSNLLRIIAKKKWIGIISHTKIDDIEADNILEFR